MKTAGGREVMSRALLIGVNAVVLGVTGDQPRILTVEPQTSTLGDLPSSQFDALRALPFGPFDPDKHRTLELSIREFVRNQTNSELDYVEQLYTFADQGRDPRERSGDSRVMSVAYLALWREEAPSGVGAATWEDCYGFFPWEDWRGGRPALMEDIEAALRDWADQGTDTQAAMRRERVEICFGLGDAGWDAYKTLERYELLYEARLIPEFWFDEGQSPPAGLTQRTGQPMAFDHRRILATGLSRVRGKLRYRPLAFELLPPTFTLLRLQQVVESVSGLTLHKQNFRRLVESSGLVEVTGERPAPTGGRPAKRFRFRRAVLKERRAPGVGSLTPPRD